MSEKRLLIIFGASGNLSQYKLLPVILNDKLYKDGKIVLFSRHPPCEKLVEKIKLESNNQLQIEVNDYSDTTRVLEILEGHDNPAIYLALPSKIHIYIMKTLDSLNIKMSIYVEKPHFMSAEEVKIAQNFKNLSMFLIDHFLLKKTLILWKCLPKKFRENLINIDEIENIRAAATETISAENRISFDLDGILRDMIISHLFALYKTVLPNGNLETLKVKKEVLKGQYENYEFKGSQTPTLSYIILESEKNFDVELFAGKSLSKKTTFFDIKMKSGTLSLQFAPETDILFNGKSVIDKQTYESYFKEFHSLEGYNLLLYSIIHRKTIPTFPIESLLYGYKVENDLKNLNTEMIVYKKGVDIFEQMK
ncbi:glucose-6-phosphate dehydrogenase [Pseudoloma neurophilia]|uniref:glucose-6-phosphate dehydrogenase (NADP(+)) n=1 Tax=Pseudoloma neurophilia TaxID=146866 RepID=A0A0R0LUG6_9MICR|nr:glucose-6-phosphate dehydrogenase [Pseudoloma neurophilia]